MSARLGMADSHDHFREEIEYLADQAGEERARVAAESSPIPVRSPVRKLLIAGAILAVLELGLLGYFVLTQEEVVAFRESGKVIANPLLTQQDCVGERYRTYREVIRYFRDHGEYPVALDALVPKYVDHIPADPATKKRLAYSRTDQGFSLTCVK